MTRFVGQATAGMKVTDVAPRAVVDLRSSMKVTDVMPPRFVASAKAGMTVTPPEAAVTVSRTEGASHEVQHQLDAESGDVTLRLVPTIIEVLPAPTVHVVSTVGNGKAQMAATLTVTKPTPVPTPAPLIRPPGMKLRSVLGLVFTRKFMQEICEPILADMQFEWAEKMIARRDGEARWVVVRALFLLAIAVVAYAIRAIGSLSKAAPK